MSYILLFIALNQAPAQLGVYNSEKSCQNAIRAIYEQRLANTVVKTQQIQQVIDTTLKYQREYRCVPQ